jgi:hypothetical protein
MALPTKTAALDASYANATNFRSVPPSLPSLRRRAVTAPPCRHCVSNSARRFFGAGGVSSPGAADDEQWEDASSSSAGGLAEGETALISRTPVHLAAGGE